MTLFLLTIAGCQAKALPDDSDSRALDSSESDTPSDSGTDTDTDADTDSDPDADSAVDSDTDSGGDTSPAPHVLSACNECTIDDADDSIGLNAWPVVTDGVLNLLGNDLWIPSEGWAGGMLHFTDAYEMGPMADVDDDGIRDLLCSDVEGQGSVFEYSGASGAEIARYPYSGFGTSRVTHAVAGNDWIVIGVGNHQFEVYGAADTAFTTPLRTLDYYTDTPGVLEADMTGDGVGDHIVYDENYPDEWYAYGRVWIVDGSETGSAGLDDSYFARVTGSNASHDQMINAARKPVDVNGDGYLDLPVQDQGLSVYDVYSGGDLDYTAAFIEVLRGTSTDLLDFDGDGIQDMVGIKHYDDGSDDLGPSVMFSVPNGSSDFRDLATWRVNEDSILGVLDADQDGADDLVLGLRTEPYGDVIFYGGPERSVVE